jgi:Flp pilus assembly pilin Flp
MRSSQKRKSGQGLVEYALILALIALAAVVALTGIGDSVNEGLYGNINSNLNKANNTIQASP